MVCDSFVYCWTDFGTNRLYIGIHKGTPEDGYICSSPLVLQEYRQRPQDFFRNIIAFGTWKDCYALETAILQKEKVSKNPSYYNQRENHGKFFCHEHTTKTKERLSARHKGKILSLEHRAKLSASMKGRTLPPRSPEHCKNISESQRGSKRPPRSPEHNRKLSASMKGRTLPPRSPEHCKKLSDKNKGRVFSTEHCKRLSEVRLGSKNPNFGKKLSVEWKAKIAESVKKYHSTKKKIYHEYR